MSSYTEQIIHTYQAKAVLTFFSSVLHRCSEACMATYEEHVWMLVCKCMSV